MLDIESMLGTVKVGESHGWHTKTDIATLTDTVEPWREYWLSVSQSTQTGLYLGIYGLCRGRQREQCHTELF